MPGQPQTHFETLAIFEAKAEGGIADLHSVHAQDAIHIISAMSNIARRSLLLSLGRPSPSPSDLGAINVMVKAPQRGSLDFQFVVGFTEVVAGGVAMNVIANLLTPAAHAGLSRIWDVAQNAWLGALGQAQIPEDRRTEPWFESIADLGEKLHPSFQQLATPVGASVDRITVNGVKGDRRIHVATLNAETKRELSEEIENRQVEEFIGRVRQLNDKTRKGIISAFSPANGPLREGYRFWVSETREPGRLVATLAQNLADNNPVKNSLGPKDLRILARRVTTVGGRTKRIIIEDVR